MKQMTIILISLLYTITQLQADEKKSDDRIIKQLVQKVKQSKGDKRRKAMNALKIQLRSMNHATRQKVMIDLQKNFAPKQHASMQRDIQQHTQNVSPQTITPSAPTILYSPSQHPRQQGGRR